MMKKTITMMVAMFTAGMAVASEQTVGSTNVVVYVPTKVTIMSCQMRPTDPTVMDVVYKVESEAEKVKVRTLAFKDGKRDFGHVLRPETFIEGTETNLGDNVAANIEHKLSWKVTADWDINIGNVSFEVLASANATNSFVLPYMYREEVRRKEREYFIIAPKIWVYHDLEDYEVTDLAYDLQRRNVLFWFYADRDDTLSLRNGMLYWNGSICLCDGTVSYYSQGSASYRYRGNSDFHRDCCGYWDYDEYDNCVLVSVPTLRENVNEFLKVKFRSFMDVDWKISPSSYKHTYEDW